jgi:HSP20 family protein
MTTTRWDPFSGFDRMLDLVYGRGDQRRSMPIDIYRNGDQYTIEMELPGVDPSSLDVNVERNMLTVSAEARSSHEHAEEELVCERSHARFYRQLYLGDDLDLDNVQATFDNGLLRLTVPLRQRPGGRKIDVSSGGGGGGGSEGAATPASSDTYDANTGDTATGSDFESSG